MGFVPCFFAGDRNEPGGSGFFVYYPYCYLIGNYCSKSFG